jgi:peptidoglycan hydrolase CwlO-like protein
MSTLARGSGDKGRCVTVRRGGGVALLAVALTALLAGVVPGAAASSPAPAGLAARRAALVDQLAAIQGPRSGARRDLLAAEQQFSAAQRRLLDARARLAALDARLLELSRHIADDEHVLTIARLQLAALVRATYEAVGAEGFAAAILSSDSFNQAIDRVRGAEHVADQVQRLQRTVSGRESALLRERSELSDEFARAAQAEALLAVDANRLMVMVAHRDAAFRDLDGPARELARRIAEIDQELGGPLRQHGLCGNHFAYGQCTWYVASRRCIPWFGNAWEWWHNAAALGYPEGHDPRLGAIAVWGRRGHGASSVGHVALVEAVGPTDGVPAGHFKVSEMNHDGWDRVDYRVVDDGAVLGFIYDSTQ